MFEQPLVECVPNVSEGRDASMIAHFAEELRKTEGVHLLHVDPNADANRTVFTFVGAPDAVADGAFRLAAAVTDAIDMREQGGAHPRLGALDVCPLIPLSGTKLRDCAVVAKTLGERIGRELGIPVYLYEGAATAAHRVALPNVRRGQYEGLRNKMADPRWVPDFGPKEFQARSGAAIVGARRLLVAFNVGLRSTDVRIARKIAERIRAGCEREIYGTQIPGAFESCRAIGWEMPAYGCVQVSTNLCDARKSGVGEVFSAIREWSRFFGTEVRGSELIGLIPMSALLAAAHSLGVATTLHSGDVRKRSVVVEDLIAALGLRSYGSFIARERILECAIADAYGISPRGISVDDVVEDVEPLSFCE